MTEQLPSPMRPLVSRTDDLLAYLDFFRAALLRKVDGLTENQLRHSVVPSGWTPLELVQHLTFVELRWLEWGFEGTAVEDPWGDRRDDRWWVADEVTVTDLVTGLRQRAEVTEQIVRRHDLAERGAPGPRWDGAEPATLERVLLHLVQEYARHLGHLDVVRELVDGTTGE